MTAVTPASACAWLTARKTCPQLFVEPVAVNDAVVGDIELGPLAAEDAAQLITLADADMLHPLPTLIGLALHSHPGIGPAEVSGGTQLGAIGRAATQYQTGQQGSCDRLRQDGLHFRQSPLRVDPALRRGDVRAPQPVRDIP